MKKFILVFVFALVFFGIGWFAYSLVEVNPFGRQNVPIKIIPRPFDKYTFENLSKSQITPTEIEVGETLEEKNGFSSYLFSISFDPTLSGKEKKKVTGHLNIPRGVSPFPVVLMFRGYVDQEIYKTGDGTRRAAEYFAKNGYATVAPDFLGYGGSDSEANNIFESRFQTYTTALVVLKTIAASEDGPIKLKRNEIFIWGHSNGGQIALTILEITGAAYPTTLWAPVSKPFPYSILYYTDESEDRGKLIRHELAEFEKNYNPDLYSLDLYYQKIQAPLQLHQGTKDDAVPRDWSDNLAKSLLDLNLDLDYYIYPGADHNLAPSWNTVVARDLTFFNKNRNRP